MREAKVVVRMAGSTKVHDSMEIDPIDLPTVFLTGTGVLVATDYPPLVALVNRLAEYDTDNQVTISTLVWSDGVQLPIEASCPGCGTLGKVSDNFVGNAEDGELVCTSCI